MARPIISQMRDGDLRIPDGPITGEQLRAIFQRLNFQLNPYFDGLNKLVAKGITTTDNLKCDLVTGSFTHAVPATVQLSTLLRASSALVLGASGQWVRSHPVVMMNPATPGARPSCSV